MGTKYNFKDILIPPCATFETNHPPYIRVTNGDTMNSILISVKLLRPKVKKQPINKIGAEDYYD